MALTADREYETIAGQTVEYAIEAGAADELYKGALVNIGTDGMIKVAADVASEVPIGVMKKHHTSNGTSHEKVEIEGGQLWIYHSGAAQTDVGQLFFATADDTLADSATNVKAFGICVGWKTDYLLIDTRIQKLI